MRHTLKLTALIATLCLVAASPALAHGGEDHTGPFRVVVNTSLPEKAVSVSVENGSLTLTVTPGHSVSVLGYDDEESLRIDESGVIWTRPSSMMAQMADPVATGDSTASTTPDTDETTMTTGTSASHDMTHTEEAATTDMASPTTYAESPESNWKKIGDGGIVLYHEHRCHFMGTQISQSIATGGRVASFNLPFLVDGEKFALTGDLIFDPSMDPQKAAELLGGTHNHTSGPPPLLLAALIVAALGLGLLLFRKAAAARAQEALPQKASQGSAEEPTPPPVTPAATPQDPQDNADSQSPADQND